jgi:hypothetical protein
MHMYGRDLLISMLLTLPTNSSKHKPARLISNAQVVGLPSHAGCRERRTGPCH